MSKALSFILGAALVGCATVSTGESEMPTPVTICQIMNSDDMYVSKTVRLNARFNTDLRHFAFLQDKTCGERNLLDIGRVRGNAEYEELRESWLAVCEQRGSAGLCVIDELVDVVGKVRRSDQDNLVLDVIGINASSKNDVMGD